MSIDDLIATLHALGAKSAIAAVVGLQEQNKRLADEAVQWDAELKRVAGVYEERMKQAALREAALRDQMNKAAAAGDERIAAAEAEAREAKVALAVASVRVKDLQEKMDSMLDHPEVRAARAAALKAQIARHSEELKQLEPDAEDTPRSS